MSKVIPFRKPSPPKGHTLCRSGHHRWRLESASRFDVKQGRLVTVHRCERCGKTRVKAL